MKIKFIIIFTIIAVLCFNLVQGSAADYNFKNHSHNKNNKKSFWSEYKYWIIGGVVVAGAAIGTYYYIQNSNNNSSDNQANYKITPDEDNNNIDNNLENSLEIQTDSSNQSINQNNNFNYVPKDIRERENEFVKNYQASPITKKININTATSQDLMNKLKLNNLDARILVKYRTRFGLFRKIEDLKKVPGVGDKYDILKDRITVH